MSVLEVVNNIIRYDDDGDFGCRLCNVYWNPAYNINDHVNTPSHQEKLQEINDLIKGQFINLPTGRHGRRVRCTLCSCFLGFLPEPIFEHIEGGQHRMARANALKPLNGLTSVEGNKNELWCKVCSEYLDNTVDDIIDHVDDDEEHARRCDLMEEYDDNIDFTHYLASYPGKVRCTTCQVNVNCTFNNDLKELDTHIDGSRHRIAYADSLKPLNGLVPVKGNNDELWCKVCSEYLDNDVSDIFDHVDDDEEHGRRCDLMEEYDESIDFAPYLASYPGKVRCNACQVNVECTFNNDLENLDTHCDGWRHEQGTSN